MPIVGETRLQDGAIDWEARRTDESIRCDRMRGGCGTVHPGEYMREVDQESGLCVTCRKEGTKDADVS